MAKLLRRSTKESVKQVKDAVDTPSNERVDLDLVNRKVSLDHVVSTGSTLLDLAISGLRREEGGIPGGIVVEISGPPGAGKTALLAEICASAQKKGGDVRFADPEARLDKEYSEIYGISLSERFDYHRPNTVAELFGDHLWAWKPEPQIESAISVFGADSVAALSTEMEMEDEDKMGMRRAKEFSQFLRKTCRLIANNNWLVVFTNQIRMSQQGRETTPGGMALPFYASLRIRVGPSFRGSKIEKKTKFGTKEVDKVIGIHSTCKIIKSSIDEPYREVPLSIIFNYGVDTIRDELQFFKEMTSAGNYDCFTKQYVSLEQAIRHIEEKDRKSVV